MTQTVITKEQFLKILDPASAVLIEGEPAEFKLEKDYLEIDRPKRNYRLSLDLIDDPEFILYQDSTYGASIEFTDWEGVSVNLTPLFSLNTIEELGSWTDFLEKE